MEKNGVQFLFMKHIYFDSVIQLKNGRILFYYFKNYDYIFIYNEKTFQKILDIDIYNSIKEYENKCLLSNLYKIPHSLGTSKF